MNKDKRTIPDQQGVINNPDRFSVPDRLSVISLLQEQISRDTGAGKDRRGSCHCINKYSWQEEGVEKIEATLKNHMGEGI